MKTRSFLVLLPPSAAVAALILLWAAFLTPALGLSTSQDVAVEELTLSGAAYEVNLDSQGHLWVSVTGADEVWQVDPAASIYTAYVGLPSPVDARRGAGDVWWLDGLNKRLGRLRPATGVITTWALPGTGPLYGLQFDDAGQVWATSFEPILYRFDPATTGICTYTLPSAGSAIYLAAGGGSLWTVDWRNGRATRLDVAGNRLTQWLLAESGASPVGVTLDAAGNLWWADQGLGELGRLEPDSNRWTRYALPFGSTPKMVAAAGSKLFFTEDTEGTAGVLDPSQALGVSTTLVSTTITITPTCGTLGVGISDIITSITGTLDWNTSTVTPTATTGGWAIYQFPSNSSPWGIAFSAEHVFVVDSGREVLYRFTGLGVHSVYLPIVIK